MPYIREEYHRLASQKQPEQIKVVEEPKPAKRAKGEGVIVEGIDNCLIKLSRCCAPIPGDEIIGFITRGHGVSIHKRDCPNVPVDIEKAPEPYRWVDASWSAGTETKEFNATIAVLCEPSAFIMADIANVLAEMRIMINAVNTRGEKGGRGTVFISVTVKSTDSLNVLISRLKNVQGVIDITRRTN